MFLWGARSFSKQHGWNVYIGMPFEANVCEIVSSWGRSSWIFKVVNSSSPDKSFPFLKDRKSIFGRAYISSYSILISVDFIVPEMISFLPPSSAKMTKAERISDV